MPAAKPRPTLADYVAIALGPGLIMALIVSVVYFVLEILYVGDFVGRLQWIFFFYIFGSVLVARLAMATEVAARAPLYAVVLALLVWLGMGQFVNYPPGWEALSWLINAGLIAFVWWSSHRLTWDCTHIDEEATGTGLLQAAGLGEEEPPADDGGAPPKREPRTWWERYDRYREERKKKHTPGVWVVYFSLAALPVFGLGQSLIPAEEAGRRLYAFWLMGLYAASALGLLVTTAFLGLRRYLRQRSLQMPKSVTAAWLTVGAALSVGLLLVGALLPRPEAEFSVLDVTRLGSKKRDASRYAMKGGDQGKGEGSAGAQQRDDKQGAPVNSGQKDKQGGGGKGEAKGQGQGDKKSNQQGGSDKKGGKTGGEKGERSAAKKGDDKGQDGKKDGNDENQGKGDPENGEKAREEEASKSSGNSSNRSRTSSWSPPPILAKVSRVLKWVVFALIAVAAVVFVMRGGLRYLANFFDWARDLLAALRRLWEMLFGGGPRETTEADGSDGDMKEVRPRPRPFHLYPNPFLDGRAGGMTPAEVTRYSFEALEAWAIERGVGRKAEETPIEFATRLGDEAPSLEADAKRLAALYARVLYARGALPPSWRASLEQFWTKIEAAAEQPLSA